MAIDKSQFFQVFFEEAGEHLAELERLLLGLDLQSPNGEDLNAIFRAVHSIKGGAGTFGFTDLVEVAHVFETILDKVRNDELGLKKEMVDLFLEAGDVLKKILDGHKEGREADPAGSLSVREGLKAILKENEAPVVKKEGSVPAAKDVPAEDPGYGFFDELPQTEGVPVPDNKPAEDPGYGFFQDIPLHDPRSPEGIAEKRIEGENKGRRAADYIKPGDPPMRAGRRATDPVVISAQTEATTLRVGVEKVDQLINQVGELVITQAMLAQTVVQLEQFAHEKLQHGLAQLERNTRDLQESVMAIRMVPINIMFSRFPRLVRDLAGKLNKEVELKIIGGETEMDKGLIEKLVDPMTHLVRNSLDHGIESTEKREAEGKSRKGVITLAAAHQGGNVVIKVSDDGAGLNRQKILAKAAERGIPISKTAADQEVWSLIFAPGFSTADQVTDVSGRGVGMDVVKKNVQAIGGRVEIQSEYGKGSHFIMRLPLTLAIIEGMSLRVGSEVYIAPLTSIVESIRPRRNEIKTVVGKGEVVEVRGEYVPIARLYQLLDVNSDLTDPALAVLVLVESEGKRLAIMVDELLGQQQVVIKSLEQNFRRVDGVAGATILGDGHVAFILDVHGVITLMSKERTLLSA
ncbi:MAG: chemotaxis protein CheW [Nitrospirae bacterium]|nr:chemotaxis protein CheW [Nitrospirota bacterium]